MFATQRLRSIAASPILKRQLHSSSYVMASESKQGLFSKLNPWASKTDTTVSESVATPVNSPEDDKVTFRVDYEEEEKESIKPWLNEAQLTDKAEIEAKVKSVILERIQEATETNWKGLPFKTLTAKFKVIKDAIKETGIDVPNYKLNELNTTDDILYYFTEEKDIILTAKKQQNETIKDFFEENRESLPSNMVFVPRD
ncbi:hypothetical protein BDF20DRAFT_917169 [Mycotypha africana]|uniref:uncharacterized protein n=1 Tax=Mycotypha africana TaxID=64632 RepID=UPI002300D5C9|nr:uncharacterized protein BDF20DRAFT_917169 [Mycotypha africana]KAI8967919.1 hypothetical protein BDF20DRAFT_917169 [Mycotypha africana]